MEFLQRLARPPTPIDDAVAIIVAHPDDETLGCGAQLPRLRRVTILHLTDGAPGQGGPGARRGPSAHHGVDAAAYAALRRAELRTAMARVGITDPTLMSFAIADGEAALHLAPLARRLARLFAERAIERVLTHAYEGGHADHDAAAFAVHAAARLIARDGGSAPAIIEMPFYRAIPGGWVKQRFAPPHDGSILRLGLDAAAWALKQRMLADFASQQPALGELAEPVERFRPAPRYDFTRLPNGGLIAYDVPDALVSSQQWCRLAEEALRALGLAAD